MDVHLGENGHVHHNPDYGFLFVPYRVQWRVCVK